MVATPDTPRQRAQRCARCGAGFTCGMQAGLAECWCARLPPIDPPLGAGTGCLCPDCLDQAVRIRAATTPE